MSAPTVTFDRSYVTIDKTGWGEGPWNDEPDKAQWVDSETDLDCLIVRNPVGALCGYVGVPPNHPWHRVAYSGCTRRECPVAWERNVFTHLDEPGQPDCTHTPLDLLDVHGGITFTDVCAHGDDESTGICHVPGPGRPDELWWFGFDCVHYGDYWPLMAVHMAGAGDLLSTSFYRDVAYVRDQCAHLAAQLLQRYARCPHCGMSMTDCVALGFPCCARCAHEPD